MNILMHRFHRFDALFELLTGTKRPPDPPSNPGPREAIGAGVTRHPLLEGTKALGPPQNAA